MDNSPTRDQAASPVDSKDENWEKLTSKRLTDKLGLGSLRVFVQAKNLITWTKYSGLDPEINLQNYGGGGSTNLDIGIDRGAYPVSKSVLLGINLTL